MDTSHPDDWRDVLRRCGAYDFHHTVEYHAFHEQPGHVTARLLVHDEGERLAALPLLVRSLRYVPGLPAELRDCQDATSVHGYGGPITNSHWSDAEFTERFQSAVQTGLQSERVIAAFSRMHPLLGNSAGLMGLGETQHRGPTVSIDLTKSEERQQEDYRKECHRKIRKCREAGMVAERDGDWRFFDDWVRIYSDTMDYLDASSQYHFDRDYFQRLREALGERLHLFVVLLRGRPICASLVVVHDGILHDHFNGTDPEHRKASPRTMLVDAIRRWGMSIGARRMFLGGGLGAAQDGLFQFKAGFSPLTHTFDVWCLVVDQDAYERATQFHQQWRTANQLPAAPDTYFPSYRAPA